MVYGVFIRECGLIENRDLVGTSNNSPNQSYNMFGQMTESLIRLQFQCFLPLSTKITKTVKLAHEIDRYFTITFK